MEYQKLVAQIRDLPWASLTPRELKSLMILSGYSAIEFAESLRLALEHHPDSLAFREMAAGELNTNNIQFESYSEPGDHKAFLWHFIHKHGLTIEIETPSSVSDAGQDYLREVRALPLKTRIMSVVSREQELPGIFDAILGAPGWDEHPALQAFKYYLERHIELDSGDGGHAALLAEFKVDDSVAPFYDARLRMYRAIPALFPTA